MNKTLGILVMLFGSLVPVTAQRMLNLDSCRALALRNNKQLQVSNVKQDVAANLRHSARTKYLPHVSAVGSYVHTTREVSVLSDGIKGMLPNLGTSIASGLGNEMGNMIGSLPPQTLATLGQLGLSPEALSQLTQPAMQDISASGNALGQEIADAFRTDTRNIWAGSVMLTQPIFMGGGIIALNKMADIGEDLMRNQSDLQLQSTIYTVDQAYWQVVSLWHKKKLAEAYLELVKKLDTDVSKMIDEGVATRSEGLSVKVKVNEAEMQVTQVNDGLVLSKMLLCQLCGLPLDEQILLPEETQENLVVDTTVQPVDVAAGIANRPEMRMLQNTVDLSRQATNLLKAGNLPQVALVGGYTITNPSVFNGFEKKFGGMWNVGVLVRIPIWNWGDVAYKVRASKGATAIANLEMADAREKMELQINQSQFRVNEAFKKLEMARTNIERADENLRMANLGFQEGVIQSTTVMEAQTAWLQAQSQKIDSEINLKLSQVNLQKATGTLVP
ncbi:MAG: TolC family protein [Prevotella sp.]|nr:TolC family protein [Prevotella sp.]